MAKIVKEFIHADQKHVGITEFYPKVVSGTTDEFELYSNSAKTVKATYDEVSKAIIAGTLRVTTVTVDSDDDTTETFYAVPVKIWFTTDDATGKRKVKFYDFDENEYEVKEAGYPETAEAS